MLACSEWATPSVCSCPNLHHLSCMRLRTTASSSICQLQHYGAHGGCHALSRVYKSPCFVPSTVWLWSHAVLTCTFSVCVCCDLPLLFTAVHGLSCTEPVRTGSCRLAGVWSLPVAQGSTALLQACVTCCNGLLLYQSQRHPQV